MKDSHLLRIRHRTHYRYAQPVSFQTHRLAMRPREGHDLRVERLELAITPGAEMTWAWDVFGNSIAYAHILEPGAELKFALEVVVRRFPPRMPRPASPTAPAPFRSSTTFWNSPS